MTASTPDKSAGAFVRKYSPDFGEVKWTWTVPNCFLDWAGGLQRSMPALGDDGNLYIVSRENSSVYRINTESGEGAKVFSYPAAAYPNKAQTGINICDGKLVSAFSGLRSGVIAVADIGVNPQKSWSTVVGDPCGTKSYEAAWGLPDQLSSLEIPIGTQNAYMFDAKSNSDLVSDLLRFLDRAAAKVEGTPLSEKFKTLRAEVVANYDSDPFEWIDRVNTFVTENIAGYTPEVFDAPGEPEGVELARRLLLLLRDYPLHEVSLTNDVVSMEPGQADAFNASIAKVQEAVVDKLLAWLDTPAPAPGVLELFKIYNMGYVARTADHCIGIDIYWWSSQEKMKKLCDSIEAIFVTHAHGDHFNLELLTEMSSREGKYLFMTTGTKNMFTPASSAALYAWDSSVLEPVDCDGLSVSASIGAQGDLPCQLFSIGMDGFCIWACGDNGKDTAYDVAAANFNAPHLTMVSVAGAAGLITKAGRSAKGAVSHDVAYVVSHENEVHHTIDGRVAYKFFFESPRTLEDNVYSKNVGKYAALDYGEILTISAGK
ncbi:MAG: hypothetical protein MJY56_07600 [Bacteroidales bacterium]|nr:hypothetical protein [Bacteroidales bacterium]